MSTALIQINAIDHINLTVTHLDASIRFYQNAFGFELIEDGRKPDASRAYAILGIPGTAALALHSIRSSEETGNGDFAESLRINHWGFAVDDFDIMLKQLQQSNIQRSFLDDYPEGVIRYPGSRSIYITDPDGHEIELTERFAGGLMDQQNHEQ